MPGSKGNKNAMTHGTHSFLALGRLPEGASYIRRLIGGFKTALDNAVVDKHGEITLFHAAIVQTACRHEGRAQLLTRWLREANKLSLTDRLAVLREIGNASDARDKCLKALGLDSKPESDPWAAALDATPKIAGELVEPVPHVGASIPSGLAKV